MKTNTLKGMRDILPEEQKLRDYVQQKILETYRNAGFERISTPILEDLDNLDKSDGGDNLSLIFKVLKRGDKLSTALDDTNVDAGSLSDMGLRYDLTLPLSRFYAANYDSLQFPFRVIQADRVYRAERPQKGRLREFVQCDIDILGDPSPNAEVELIDVTARAMLAIGFDDFSVNINDRCVLRNMLENFGFTVDMLDSVCISFDKLDKIGPDEVRGELVEKGFPSYAIESLYNFIVEFESNGTVSLDNVASRCSDQSIANNLRYIIETVRMVSGGRYKINYCPSLVRGQNYYTGTVFEISCPQFNGSVGGGGRYDNMIGKFTGRDVPAVGFSIGFERICAILSENKYQIPDAKEKCAILYEDGTDFVKVMKKSEDLRENFNVAIFKMNKRLGPQFSMLEKAGFTHFEKIRK